MGIVCDGLAIVVGLGDLAGQEGLVGMADREEEGAAQAGKEEGGGKRLRIWMELSVCIVI